MLREPDTQPSSDHVPPSGTIARRTFKCYVGVDLGGGRGKTTALAVLRPRSSGPLVLERLAPRRGQEPLYDESLLAALSALGSEALIAVDAPLTPPPCIRCQVPICPGQSACVDPAVVYMRDLSSDRGEASTRDSRRGKPAFSAYTQRATEIYLHTRRGLSPREALGQGTGPLCARGIHLARALAGTHTLNTNLIEVCPRATLRWLPQLASLRAEPARELSRRYKKHVDERETRVRILDALSALVEFAPGIWREDCVRSDHHFDAVMCALTGYLWAAEGWQRPAEAARLPLADGWIWVPPPTTEAATADTLAVNGHKTRRPRAGRR